MDVDRHYSHHDPSPLIPVLSLSCPCLKPGAEPWSLGSCCCTLNKISFKGCLLQGYDKLTHPQLNCKFIPYQYETIFLLSFEYFLEERFPLIELKMAYFHEVTIMILLWSYFDLHSISGAPSAKFYISQNTNDAFCNLQNDPTHFNNTATSMLILLPLHTPVACSLFQPICQLLIQCLDPPETMWDSSYISA